MFSFLKNAFHALSNKEKRVLWIALSLLLAGGIGLGVLIIKNNTAIVPAYRGTYNEGVVGQPSYINPVLAASDIDQGLTRLAFADLQELSEDIQASEDGKSVRVRLKENLTWSDGEALTTDDVIFTLESIQNPDSRSPLAGLFEGVTAERNSALEIEFQIKNLALAGVISELRPIPRHLYNDIPAGNWKLSDYNLRPISSGPYVFASREANSDGFISTYRLNSNKDYAAEEPYIQKINFLFFHDQDQLVEAFNNGQIQGFSGNNPDLLEKIQRPYASTEFTTPTVYAVFWNDTANPALEPVESRWALSLAIDRDKVLESLSGLGTVANGPLPPGIMPQLETPARATSTTSRDPNEILEQRGWEKGEDGIWAKDIDKTEVRLEFSLTVPDIEFLKKVAEELISQWRDFGANVSLNVLPTDDSLLAAITNRGYDGLLFGNTIRGAGDLYPFWHSSRRFAPGLNLAIYQNNSVDSLLEDLREENNPEKRSEILQNAATMIADDEPAVFLFSAKSYYAHSKNVQGVSEGFLDNPADRLSDLPEWYVNTTRRFAEE